MGVGKVVKVALVAFLTFTLAVVCAVSPARAATPAAVNLGSAASFAVLAATYATTGATSTFNGNLAAGAAITTGASNAILGSMYSGAATTVGAANLINGNIYSGAAITLGAGSTVSGSQYFSAAPLYSNATNLYTSAMSSVNTAITDINNRTATSISGTLDGVTLTPGVYSSVASLGLTGVLTLDAQGDSNAVFIIKSNSYLVTAATSAVVLTNQAQAKNVFWAPQGYFTAGADSIFKGSVLAATYISIGAGTAIEGHLFSQSSYVVFGAGSADSVFGITGIGTTEIATTDAGLTPTFGAPTPTADGFTVQITNYSGFYTWAGTATASGAVVVSSTGLVTVSGVAAGTSSTTTITTTRTGYTGGTASVSDTSITGAAVKTIEFTDTTLNDGTRGQAYNDYVAAQTLLNGSANNQTVTYSISPSPAHLGLSINTSGVVTGIVSTTAPVETHSFTVTATSLGYVTETYVYPLVIKAAAVVPAVVVPAVVVPAVVVPAVVVPNSATYKSIMVTINFKSGSSKLSATEKRKILRLVAKFGPKVIDGIIVGHVQSDGNRKNDAKLSAARARVIARFLSDQGMNVPMLTQGKGALNESAKSRKSTLTIRYEQ